MAWLPAAFGFAFLGFALLVLATILFYVARWLSGRGSMAQTGLDDYLRSTVGNTNPSHIPPTYTPKIRSGSGGRWGRQIDLIEELDSPEVQKQKYENSRHDRFPRKAPKP
jgi:hypothetical protein